MFRRNIADKTGLEPCRLFNAVQFMMYDRGGTGRVSLDEAMRMLYARYGKERLEMEMKARVVCPAADPGRARGGGRRGVFKEILLFSLSASPWQIAETSVRMHPGKAFAPRGRDALTAAS